MNLPFITNNDKRYFAFFTIMKKYVPTYCNFISFLLFLQCTNKFFFHIITRNGVRLWQKNDFCFDGAGECACMLCNCIKTKEKLSETLIKEMESKAKSMEKGRPKK